jgi:hypothetical protein
MLRKLLLPLVLLALPLGGCAHIESHRSETVISRKVEEFPPVRLPARDGERLTAARDGDDVVLHLADVEACVVPRVENRTVHLKNERSPGGAGFAIELTAFVGGALIFTGALIASKTEKHDPDCNMSDGCGPSPVLFLAGDVMIVGGIATGIDLLRSIDGNDYREERAVLPGPVIECRSTPVAGRPLAVRVGGATVQATTDDRGEARVRVPRDLTTIEFDHHGTRLPIDIR